MDLAPKVDLTNVGQVVGRRTTSQILVVLAACSLGACNRPASEPAEEGSRVTETPGVESDEIEIIEVDPEPEVELKDPVTLWSEGGPRQRFERAELTGQEYLVLDLGDEWTPYIFTEFSVEGEPPKPQTYRNTYLALASGRFPDNHHGDRARKDKYLELFGILPTLNLLKKRFEYVEGLTCTHELDLEPLKNFDGLITYNRSRRSIRDKRRYDELQPTMATILQRTGDPDLSTVDRSEVSADEWELIEEYRKIALSVEAIIAAQQRLECEGFFRGRQGYQVGIFDWRTHEALAEFERRHRVYGWGFLGHDTMEVLRLTPAEAERQAVVRMLTERAMHAAGVIEDGSQALAPSGDVRTYVNSKGQTVPLPNFEAELEGKIVEAFGLQTPESTYAWLAGLERLPGHYLVAIQGITRPDYYSNDMDLIVYVDRGDIWYEFPWDQEGKERPQPIKRRPKITVYTRYEGQRIPLVEFGTTVGGWRSEYLDGTMMWKYKDSPIGDRIWSRIVAGPVWVPPETTPPRSLLNKTKDGFEVNYDETGPGYASAYGLVAAYHRKYWRDQLGDLQVGGDEGIRTHGSVDYMSIMRRNSHGCHRLHNHLAVRLMSFVLQHRPHQRIGARMLNYEREFEYEDEMYTMVFDNGGYIFELDEPMHVRVLPGRIRGQLRDPIEYPLPKYNDELGAYVMPDGSWVNVDRWGNLTPRQAPPSFEPPPPADPFEEFDLGLEPRDPAAPVSSPVPAPVTSNGSPRPSARSPQVQATQQSSSTIQ